MFDFLSIWMCLFFLESKYMYMNGVSFLILAYKLYQNHQQILPTTEAWVWNKNFIYHFLYVYSLDS